MPSSKFKKALSMAQHAPAVCRAPPPDPPGEPPQASSAMDWLLHLDAHESTDGRPFDQNGTFNSGFAVDIVDQTIYTQASFRVTLSLRRSNPTAADAIQVTVIPVTGPVAIYESPLPGATGNRPKHYPPQQLELRFTETFRGIFQLDAWG